VALHRAGQADPERIHRVKWTPEWGPWIAKVKV
jgi:hypothetical protein